MMKFENFVNEVAGRMEQITTGYVFSIQACQKLNVETLGIVITKKGCNVSPMVRRDSCTVPFEDTWNPLVFSGNGCALACFQEDGCKCCIPSDHQKDSSDTCTKILKQEQIHEVYFDDNVKNHLIDRIELIDQKLKDGFLFRNIRASKWESGYKDQILNALNSPYPLDAKASEIFEKVIEDLEENLYDAKREAEDLDRECTAKALKDMLIMDGIQTNTLSKNEECKGEKNDFCN